MGGHTVNSCSVKDHDDNAVWQDENGWLVTCENLVVLNVMDFAVMLHLQSWRRAEALVLSGSVNHLWRIADSQQVIACTLFACACDLKYGQ